MTTPDEILKKLDEKAIQLLDQAIPSTISGSAEAQTAPGIAEAVKAFEAVTKYFGQRLAPAPPETNDTKGSPFGQLRKQLTDGRGARSRPRPRKASPPASAPAGDGDDPQPDAATDTDEPGSSAEGD